MFLTLVLTTLPALAPVPAAADVLLIEEVRQAESLTLPVNGQRKTDVEAAWGQPLEKRGPVGDPPISQWQYKDWSVYFEYDLVLSTVLHPGAVIEKDQSPES